MASKLRQFTILGLYLACLIVAGCATHAQRQYQQLETQYRAAFSSMNSCFETLRETSVMQRLNEIFIVDTNDPRTVEKLALRSHVTEQEAQDIVKFSVMRRPCYKIALEEFGQVHPEYVASLATVFAEADADLAKAINNELTIGEINQRSIDRVNRWQAEFLSIGQRIATQLNQAHQYEVQQRAVGLQRMGAGLQQMGQGLQPVQQPQSYPQSTIITRPDGRTVHCTSWPMGNTTTVNCN